MIEILFAVVAIYLLFDIRSSVQNRKPRSHGASSVVMDTSALIDGRILDVAKNGFLSGVVIVPKRVIQEMQLLADGRDGRKRERARFGLDVVQELQQLKSVEVIIDEYKLHDTQPTDDVVLHLARDRRAFLCTTDYNLNKVAKVEGVAVLNVNELAHSMRPRILPGEIVSVKVIQKGESKGQGVGYLEDGTMIVVDNGYRMKGTMIEAMVDRMIQTKAGKMVFATYEGKSSKTSEKPKNT